MGIDNTQEVLLFPAFKHIGISHPWQDHLHDFASYITTSPTKGPKGIYAQHIRSPTILVCTHGGRDKRCGVLGPLLVKEFRDQIQSKDNLRRPEPSPVLDEMFDPWAVNVGGISHVGGHKWAGNVIVYIPPNFEIEDEAGPTNVSPLAGKGIWYGRVEPKHVDGILRETVLNGRVIQELFRGGVDQQGNPLRI